MNKKPNGNLRYVVLAFILAVATVLVHRMFKEETPTQHIEIITTTSIATTTTTTTETTAEIEEPSVFYFPELSEELNVVVQVVMAEAGNQTLAGKCYVAGVIKNRCIAYNAEPLEVVQKPGQFATPWQPPAYSEDQAWLRELHMTQYIECASAVEAVFLEGIDIPEAMYFVNPTHASPTGLSWIVNNCTYLFSEDDHDFYK